MRFVDIVKEFANQDDIVVDQVIALYPAMKKSAEGYRHVINELKKLKPQRTKMSIRIDYIKDEEESWWDVSGYYPNNSKDQTSYAIEYTRWERWLGMTVDPISLKQMSMLDFYCHCLWEMTWSGFEQEDIQGRMAEITKSANEAMKQIAEEKA